jgi:CBS domain-containing protein
MLVAEIMSTDLVTCPPGTSLQTAAGRLLENGVGSVIVEDEDQPVGIVTETDLIHAGYVTERPFTEIPTRKVMSRPLRTISPGKTLREATRRMKEENIKKLVVVEEMDVAGILSAQDIIRSYPELRSEITDIVHPPQRRDFEGI